MGSGARKPTRLECMVRQEAVQKAYVTGQLCQSKETTTAFEIV